MKIVFSVLKIAGSEVLRDLIRFSYTPPVIIFTVLYFSITLCLSEFTTTLTFHSSTQHIVKFLVLTYILHINRLQAKYPSLFPNLL